MDMINMPVTLIVKAPNQQIEDQTIKCQPSWSIRKLKGYLAEVYPSKPRTEDQKLIYSGQLLSDTVILKDVLRKYDGQETHTVHLVCTSQREFVASSAPRLSTKMNENRQDSSTATPDNNGESQSNTNTDTSSDSDGLRQRLTSQPTASSTRLCDTSTSGTVPGTAAFPPTDPRAMWTSAMAQPYPAGAYDPNNVAQQLMYMQQAYVQYMSQYMQMLAANGGQYPTTNGQQVYQQVPEQPVVNNQPEPQPEDVANVPVGEDDEGRGNRDWLDWFYIMSRVMVLFSIVYFYSSPTRFVLVSALGMMMYLYQVGFFRAHQLQAAQVEADNNNHARDARLAENNNLRNNQEENPPVNNEDHSTTETEPANEVEVHEERPSLLALTWTFFSTFFASLIPEQPGV